VLKKTGNHSYPVKFIVSFIAGILPNVDKKNDA